MNNTINQLQQKFEIVANIDLSNWNVDQYQQSQQWLNDQCQAAYKNYYLPQQRIVFWHTHDAYISNERPGLLLKNLEQAVNKLQISNCFVLIVSTNPDIATEMAMLNNWAEHEFVTGNWTTSNLTTYPYSKEEHYRYGSFNPIKIKLSDISQHERDLLTKSKTFCIYPWIHLHVFPTGDAHPCCYSEMTNKIGNAKTHTLKEIWNDAPMRDLRMRMLNDQKSDACKKCYEQESNGFFSGRQSANKHHGHHISRALSTDATGYVEQFEMTYWDIRFSNLCNLRCRSCGHIFSSQWYNDQAQIAGDEWKKKNKVLKIAGRYETDMWEQLEPHLDYVEQIYFAGGEPLLMEDHYHILDELVKRKRFDVRLTYNTNFTHTDLKGRSVFEYWKLFDSVAVGASLDAMGSRGEYIRKGTDWGVVEQNRRDMLNICPDVDFYISPTLSILNAWHVPDFHRAWVEAGLIQPQDLNVNILQDPQHYRIDIATAEYKQKLELKYQQHLEWLQPKDPLNRATQGFESAITFMNSIDNTHLIDSFWRKTHELDNIRNERCLDIIPELKALL